MNDLRMIVSYDFSSFFLHEVEEIYLAQVCNWFHSRPQSRVDLILRN